MTPHTQKEEELKNEWLTSDFVEILGGTVSTLMNDHPIDIVDWFLQKRKTELEKLIEEVEKMKLINRSADDIDWTKSSYDDALSDVINKLKEKI